MKLKLIFLLFCGAVLLWIFQIKRTQVRQAHEAEVQRQYAELRAKAEAGDAKAQCDLGSVYFFSRFGIPYNSIEAMKWFREAAEQNYAEAECRLGTGYQYGVGLKVDCSEALKWYRKSAEHNYPEAYWRLANDWCGERNVTPAITNEAERFQLLLKSAELGYAGAYNDLGSCYYNGNGVEIDLVEAYKWYSMAGINWDHYNESVQFMKDLKGQLTPKQFEEAQHRIDEWKRKHN